MPDQLLIGGAVGLTARIPQGNTGFPFAQGKDGAQIVSQSHGKYFEAADAGRVFKADVQAAQAVSVALTTTYTGLCLSNPNASDVDLELLRVGLALSVAPAAIASLHLIGNKSATEVTHTTPSTTLGPTKIGASYVPAAKVDTAATIPTPIYLAPLCSGFTAAALPSMSPTWIDVEGLYILEPGAFIAIGALTAVTGFWGFVWRENPRSS